MDARRLLVRLGPALAAGAALTFSPAAASQAYAAPPPATTEVTQNFHQDPPPDPFSACGPGISLTRKAIKLDTTPVLPQRTKREYGDA